MEGINRFSANLSIFYFGLKSKRSAMIWLIPGLIFLLISSSFAFEALANFSPGKKPEVAQVALGFASDPLRFVLGQSFSLNSMVDKAINENDQHLRKLVHYRGLYAEGENLKNYCLEQPQIDYVSKWQENQAKRAMMSTLQYIVLDYSVKALASYAQFLEFSKSEYELMIDNLVGQNCNQNLSVISLKKLRKNFESQFMTTQNKLFQLPEIKGSAFFPDQVLNLGLRRDQRENEFNLTLQLFRASCSWDGRVDHPRLLTSLLKSPHIYAYVIMQLAKRQFDLNPVTKKIITVYDPNTVQVACENFICRRVNEDKFSQLFPQALGSIGAENDLQRLYCSYFSKLNYYDKTDHPEVQKWIDQTTLDQFQLKTNHLIALLTGLPDFLVWSQKYQDAQAFLKGSILKTWNHWANQTTQNLSEDLYFEETLIVESSPQRTFEERFQLPLKVSFDINLGEFDRIVSQMGKVKTHFTLRLHQSFLKYIRDEWSRITPDTIDQREKLLSVLRRTISGQVEQAKKLFVLAPWTSDLETLIVEQLIDQLENYQGQVFNDRKPDLMEIPVVFYYGNFALKYLQYRFQTQKDFQAMSN
jgi:hypothetical protein